MKLSELERLAIVWARKRYKYLYEVNNPLGKASARKGLATSAEKLMKAAFYSFAKKMEEKAEQRNRTAESEAKREARKNG